MNHEQPVSISLRADWARRIAPALLAGLLILAVVAVGWSRGPSAYAAVVRAWGVSPVSTTTFAPFLDSDMILSGLRCRRMGLDVYVVNPCDALARPYDYSPIWLALSALPVTTAWVAPFGAAMVFAFLFSLLLLPPGRGWPEAAVVSAGVASTATAFAVERGNCDLLVFAIAASAAALTRRNSTLRAVGYALVLLAGLMKYFPLALLGLATREKRCGFLAVTAAAVCVVAAFVAIDGRDLARAIALIPAGPYYGDMYGASILPDGIAQAHGLAMPLSSAKAVGFALGVVAIACSAKPGLGSVMRAELVWLTAAERCSLLVGGLLIVGTFLTSQNIGYRATFLVLTLPGLTALRRVSRKPDLYSASVAIVLALLWSQGLRYWGEIAFGHIREEIAGHLRFMIWLLREMGWWWTVTLLAAILSGLVAQSEIVRSTPRLRRALATFR